MMKYFIVLCIVVSIIGLYCIPLMEDPPDFDYISGNNAHEEINANRELLLNNNYSVYTGVIGQIENAFVAIAKFLKPENDLSYTDLTLAPNINFGNFIDGIKDFVHWLQDEIHDFGIINLPN